MPTLKLTRRELFQLHDNMLAVGNLSGPRFVYCIARNQAIIKDEVTALQKSSKPGDDYLEYEKERFDLASSHAELDEATGKPKTYMDKGQEKFVIRDLKAFDKIIKDLQAKHKKAVDARLAQEKSIEGLLNEELEVFLYGLRQEDLPENITAAQLAGIFVLIDEDVENDKKDKS